MKLQHFGVLCILPYLTFGFSIWKAITHVISTVQTFSASVCGVTLVSGQMPIAAGACAVAAISTLLNAGAQGMVESSPTLGCRSDNGDSPCSLPVMINGTSVCSSELSPYTWHDITSKGVEMSTMIGHNAMAIGMNLPDYEYVIEEERESDLKDMYIEFHNITLGPEESTTLLDIYEITVELLKQNVLYPGVYRSHLTKTYSDTSLDLIIHSAPVEYTPSFFDASKA